MQSVRVYAITIGTLYLAYELITTYWLEHTTDQWLTGYKVIFLIAGVRALTRYVALELNTVLDNTRELQVSALATTAFSEVLAHYREDRLAHSDITELDHHEKLSLGYEQRTSYSPYNQDTLLSVFWCTFYMVLIAYNTLHHILTPFSDVTPLLFGTPSYTILYGVITTICGVRKGSGLR